MAELATKAPPGVRRRPWTWLAKPLFTAWLLGCVVSLLDFRALTLGRVLPAALVWTWVPLLETAALGAVWKIEPRAMGFRRAVDRFCAGDLAWWLLLIAFAALWREMGESVWLAFAGVVGAGTALRDYRFFRRDLGSPAPLRDLILERALAWIPGILLFGGGSLVPGLIERLR